MLSSVPMLDSCPHCGAKKELKIYTGLKPNIGIFFDPPQYRFCSHCGQIFTLVWVDHIAPEWSWCVPHKTVWKKRSEEDEE